MSAGAVPLLLALLVAPATSTTQVDLIKTRTADSVLRLKTDDGQGHVRYCPSADDLVVAYSAPLTPSLKDRGWTLHGGGGVATKSSFNLLAGFAEFDVEPATSTSPADGDTRRKLRRQPAPASHRRSAPPSHG